MLPSGRTDAQPILLGIDPGLRVTGYGVLRVSGQALAHLDHGAIRTTAGDHGSRLLQIYDGIKGLLDHWCVEEAAIEKQFIALNARSAFAIGEARAAAILACASVGVRVIEYTPAEIKESVTSYGRSGKAQIQEMVRMQFGWSDAPIPADAADALAIAICHSARRTIPTAAPGLGGEGVSARKRRG